MKRSLLLLLPLALLAGLWFLNSGSKESDGDLEVEQSEPQPGGSSSDAALVQGPSTEPGGVREDLAMPSTEAAEDLVVLRDDPEAEWLEGKVTWPADYRLEGDLWVYAMPQDTSRRSLDEALAWDDDPDDQEWFRSTALTQRTLTQRKDRRPLARVRVASDGSFRLPLPAWRPGMHLQVLGRHLYRKEAYRVPNPPWEQPVTVAAELGAYVHGTLQAADEAATPLDALVTVFYPIDVEAQINPGQSSSNGQYATHADAQGSFALLGIPPEEDLQLEVQPENFARVLHPVGAVGGGQTVEVEIPLTAGRTLAGRVVDEQDQPVADALVLVHAEAGALTRARRELRMVNTDAEGAFRVEALPNGNLILQAHHDAYLASETLTAANDTAFDNLVLTLQAGASLTGRTETADGQPVPDALVEAVIDVTRLRDIEGLQVTRHITSAPATRSDAQGRFTLTGLAPLPYRLEARGTLQATELLGAESNLRPGAEEVLVTMNPRLSLRGRVVDDAGAPVNPYTVALRRVLEGELISQYDHHQLLRVHDEEGRFAFENLASGKWQLEIQSATHLLDPALTLDLPRPPGEPELELALQPARAVRGIVLNPAGQPVEGARIRLHQTEIDMTQYEEPGELEVSCQSGEDGRFVFGPLARGLHQVRAEKEGYCASEPVRFDLSAGAAAKAITLTLTEGGHLVGTLFDNDGEPNPGRIITVVNSQAMTDTHTTTSDAQGSFEFHNLSPGQYQVVALNKSTTEMMAAMESGEANLADITGNMKMGTAQIEEGKTTEILLGEPPSDPILVRGQVTLGTEPVSQAFISFGADGKSLMDSMVLETLDAEGRYEAKLDGAGRYRITIQQLTGGAMQQSTVEVVRDIPKQSEVELDFALPEGRISGKVRTPGGKPAANVRISVLRQGRASTATMLGGSYVEATTDEAGAFDVRGLQAGTYVVSAGGALPLSMLTGPGQEDPLGRTTSEPIRLAEGQWAKGVSLKLAAPGRIVATVLDPDGQPVSGASLFLRDDQGRPLEAFSLVTTNNAGVCTYRGLAPGSYTVLARYQDWASQEIGPIEVRAGETTPVQLPMQPGTILHLSFRTIEGEPCAAELEVFGPEGREVSRLFGMAELQALYTSEAYLESERRLGPLPPGRYRLVATIDGEEVEKTVRLHGGDVKRVRLRAR